MGKITFHDLPQRTVSIRTIRMMPVCRGWSLQ
jgi:hypothetical protein